MVDVATLSMAATLGAGWPAACTRLIAVRDNELLVISFLGAAIFIAGVSEVLGVVDAIGAFMVGLILAGTPPGRGSVNSSIRCATPSPGSS